MTTVRHRHPLGELPQQITGPKVRRTYGKKDRNAGRAGADRNIFLADNDLENAFLGLNLTENSLTSRNLDDNRHDYRHDYEEVSRSRRNGEEPKRNSKTKPCKVKEISEPDAVNLTETQENLRHLSLIEGLSSENVQELDKIIQLSDHEHVQPFSAYTRKVSEAYNIEKIGEGSYSSVFLLTRRDTIERPNLPNGRTIIKMIPLHLSSEPAHDDTTRVSHVANEIRTLKTMDQVHGFLRYRGVVLVQGAWPKDFLHAFRAYKRRYSKRAENTDPEDTFGEDQCYALIEMQDAGHEFDTFIKRPSAFQAYDIFWMTTIFLAMAEELVEFEHRDLHSSNICINSSGGEGRVNVTKDFVANMVHEPTQRLGLTGVSVTIIDYTLSRAKLDASDSGRAFRGVDRGSKIEDEDPLENEKYEDRIQRLTYAKTSRCIAAEAKKLDSLCDSRWSCFVPRTNVCWLAYFLAVLLNRTGKQQKTKYVQGSNKTARQVQDAMIRTLKEVEATILIDDEESLPSSTSDLLAMAVRNSWISKEEIETFKQRLEHESG